MANSSYRIAPGGEGAAVEGGVDGAAVEGDEVGALVAATATKLSI